MPANEYYDSSGTPGTSSSGSSQAIRAEFDAIEVGFNKLPTLAGNANKAVVVNSGATGMTVTAGALALAVAFTTAGAGAITVNSTGATNVTLPTSGTLLASSAPLTAKSFVYSDATSNIASTAAPTNGQLLIGSTGAVPVVGSIAGTGNQITSTAGAGSITLSLPNAVTMPGSLSVTTTLTTGGLTNISYAGTTEQEGMQINNTNIGGYGVAVRLFGRRSDGGQLQVEAGRIQLIGANSWNSNATTSSHMDFYNIQSNTLTKWLRVSGSDGSLAFTGAATISSTLGVTGAVTLGTGGNTLSIGGGSVNGSIGLFGVSSGAAQQSIFTADSLSSAADVRIGIGSFGSTTIAGLRFVANSTTTAQIDAGTFTATGGFSVAKNLALAGSGGIVVVGGTFVGGSAVAGDLVLSNTKKLRSVNGLATDSVALIYADSANNINLPGNSIVTGTLSVSGTITSTVGNNSQVLVASSATTGYLLGNFTNTGGGFQWGVESSTGGSIVTGSGAYDAEIRTVGATHLWLATNSGAPQVKIVHTASATNFITFTGSNGATPAIGTNARGLDVTTVLRAAGSTNPTTGAGLELVWDGTTGYAQSYDRSAGQYKPIALYGNKLTIVAANGAESAQFTSAGYFKASSASGTYTGATGAYHELYTNNDASNTIAEFKHAGATAGNQYGVRFTLTGDPNNTSNYFATFVGNATTRAIIYSDGSIDSKTQAQNNNTVKVSTTAYADRAARGLLSTEQATTSGTTKDFTDVPAGCTVIRILFVGVSLSGTDNFRIQIGTGSFTTTGYLNTGAGGSNGTTISAANDTSGFSLPSGSATAVWHGVITLTLENASNNTWCIHGTLGRSDTNGWATVGGSVPIAGAVDRVRITTNGVNTFDAGAINTRYW